MGCLVFGQHYGEQLCSQNDNKYVNSRNNCGNSGDTKRKGGEQLNSEKWENIIYLMCAQM